MSEDPPDVAGTRDRLLAHLLLFSRALHEQGVRVPTNAGVEAARALVAVGVHDKEIARAAMKAALVTDPTDIATFDSMFEEFWRAVQDHLDPEDDDGEDIEGGLEPFGETDEDDDDRDQVETTESDDDSEGGATITSAVSSGTEDRLVGEETTETALYSPTGASERIAVGDPSIVGQSDLELAVEGLTRAIADLPGRRWGRDGSRAVDGRKTLRRSFGTGGTVLSIEEHDRKETEVECVLFVDVSRSVLDTVDRDFLVRFLRTLARTWRSTRVFIFDTEVQEITEELNAPTRAATMQALENAEAEWGGGTRIGNAIREIRTDDPTAIGRRTVVFVVSDGLEMGDVDVLEEEMATLSRTAMWTLWLNPLAASPNYQPSCRGMEVSLPFVDGLAPFTGPDDITDLARQIELHGLRSVGREYRTGSAP